MKDWININTKWNSFNNSSDVSLIIVDEHNGRIHLIYPTNSARWPIDNRTLFISNDIAKHISNNNVIKLKGSDLKFPAITGDISESADIYINPKAIMRIKSDEIKIRTTTAMESNIKIRNVVAYEKILKEIEKYFDIKEV